MWVLVFGAREAFRRGAVVARGGARNRSGPQPLEGSGRSDRRGYSLQALPAEGFSGPVPAWPLPPRQVWLSYRVDGESVRERDRGAEDLVAAREAELWEWAWRTPQACAWSLPSEAWRAQTVARWVRHAVLCESHEAKAADHAQLHRYADQVGLTTAGLREMGWKVAVDEVAVARTARAVEPVKRERRLRSAGAE